MIRKYKEIYVYKYTNIIRYLSHVNVRKEQEPQLALKDTQVAAQVQRLDCNQPRQPTNQPRQPISPAVISF